MIVLHNTAMPLTLYVSMSLVGLIVTLRFIIKFGLLAAPTSIVRCDATEELLYLTQKNGLRFQARPLSSTYMSPTVLLLAWKPTEQLQTGLFAKIQTGLSPANITIITIDNVSSKEDFRRLRVLLKFGKLNASL